MRKSFLISTSLLVGMTTTLFNFSASLAQSQLKSRASVVSYECRGFSPIIFKIVLNKNKTYSVQSRSADKNSRNISKNFPGGKYVLFRDGARFKTGKLRNQSIIRQGDNIYLVATSDEARAAEVAAADGAAFCGQI